MTEPIAPDDPAQQATLTADPPRGLSFARSHGRAWVAPVVAATALVGVTVAVLIASQHDAHGPVPALGSGRSASSILGSWELVGATDGHAIAVPTPAVSITFQDDTALIMTGVNAINLTVRYEPEAIIARFRLTTAAYDGSTDPDRRAVLRLLDALAPSAMPSPAARSTYRIAGDRLTIRVSGGILEFTRVSSASEQPAGPRSANSPLEASSLVKPS